MSGWATEMNVLGPFIAFGMVGLLALVLRWAFARGRSVVAAPPRRGRPDEYGLLVVVAEPATFVEAEVVRRRLVDAGIAATLAPTTEGPRVLVFPRDERRARELLAG